MKIYTLKEAQDTLGISRPTLLKERQIAEAAGEDMNPVPMIGKGGQPCKGLTQKQLQVLKRRRKEGGRG